VPGGGWSRPDRNGRGRWSPPAPRGSRSEIPGHGGRAVALPGAPARSGAGLDALDAALGELRAAGWPAPEDPGSDEDAELDGRDSIADPISDKVDWLRQCANWLAHLDADSYPPAVVDGFLPWCAITICRAASKDFVAGRGGVTDHDPARLALVALT
jgi:hypothetical protein